MKTTFLILLAACSQNLFALNIHDVTISASSQNTINVSLNTEAVELYYYHSWQYHISANKIAIEVFYVPGFGSIISPLNNNFVIPMNTTIPTTYIITLKIFYTNTQFSFQNLQDEMKCRFTTRFSRSTTFIKSISESEVCMPYPNPCFGTLYIPQAQKVWIYDVFGRLVKCQEINDQVNLEDLPNGLYSIRFLDGQHFSSAKIVLKKH